jgi:L-asparaginase II
MTVLPLFETTRGRIVESIHYGSIAVVDSNGKLISSYGDPQTVAFLRSSAKPFQALPFVERGGVEHFGFTQRELSLSCASHNGSLLHVQTAEAMQKKVGIEESHLQCGTHMPDDVDEFKSMIVNNRKPTPNYNNCSGKHTAMLAHAKMRGLPLENYLDINHPIQQDILVTFAEMCQVPVAGLPAHGVGMTSRVVRLRAGARIDPYPLDLARGRDRPSLDQRRAL